MRKTTISTEGAIRTLDFCAEHNIPYMLFDWLWYLPCTSHDGDATKVVDKLNMPRVVEYARERGIGIWLYVNQHALMKQLVLFSREKVFLILPYFSPIAIQKNM